MKKRGQFYLLAAIVIIVVISGFAAVSNYMEKKGSVKLYDLKEEIGIESGKVLDYGIITNEENINSLVENFTDLFQEYAGEDKDLYFIFGNYTDIWVISYEEVIIGNIRIYSSDTGSNIALTAKEATPTRLDILKEQDVHKVEVVIGGIDYDFELKPGDNFFFILSQEIEGEKHVIIS